MTDFATELAHILFGPLWFGQVFFFLVGLVGILSWTGVIKTFLTQARPGSPAGLVLLWFAILLMSVGLALYRTLWPQPDVPVFAFMLPLIGLFVLTVAIGIWLTVTTHVPSFLVPTWTTRDEPPGEEPRRGTRRR